MRDVRAPGTGKRFGVGEKLDIAGFCGDKGRLCCKLFLGHRRGIILRCFEVITSEGSVGGGLYTREADWRWIFQFSATTSDNKRELTKDGPKLIFWQGGEFEENPSIPAFVGVVPLPFFRSRGSHYLGFGGRDPSYRRVFPLVVSHLDHTPIRRLCLFSLFGFSST